MDINVAEMATKPPDTNMEEATQTHHDAGQATFSGAAKGGIPHVSS